ncbi:MAG: cache domain-containing protein, partial [Burkholderiales bacterium]
MASRPSDLLQNESRGTEDRVRAPRRYPTYTLATLLLAAFVAFAVTTYGSLKRELTQAAMARSTAVARLAAGILAERLDRAADLAESLATRVRFAELVALGDWNRAAAILQAVPGKFPYVERLFLADKSGTLQSDVPERAGVRGQNFAHRDWYRGVSREWKTYVSPVYRRTAEPQLNVISVATPVRGRDSGEVAGILVAQLALEVFFDWSNAIDLGAGASLVVVDPRGQAAHINGRHAQAPIEELPANAALQQLAAGRSGAALAPGGADGSDWLYAFNPANRGWGVLIRQPAAAAFAARDSQLMLLQVAYALFALLAATLVWTGTRVAMKRRDELHRASRSLVRHTERLRILGEIDRAVAAEKPAEEIAAAVVQPLRELLDVPRAIVNRFDLQSGEAEWVAAAGLQPHRAELQPSAIPQRRLAARHCALIR